MPKLLGLLIMVVSLAASGCQADPPAERTETQGISARPAVIHAGEGEERVLRGGAASLFIKVDPVSTGSETLMVGYSDLAPGDAIGVHRHLQEDEVMVITRGLVGCNSVASFMKPPLAPPSSFRAGRASA